MQAWTQVADLLCQSAVKDRMLVNYCKMLYVKWEMSNGKCGEA